jgi:hypothetical protein
MQFLFLVNRLSCWLLGHRVGSLDEREGQLCGRCLRPMYAQKYGYKPLWQRIIECYRRRPVVITHGCNHIGCQKPPGHIRSLTVDERY